MDQIEIDIRPKWRWQDAVTRYLGRLELSNSLLPTEEDIRNVVSFAREKSPKHWNWNDPPNKRVDRVKWVASDHNLYLNREDMSRVWFTSEQWADGIPVPQKILIRSDSKEPKNTIRLFTVASFKGLEADGVILVIPPLFWGDEEQLRANLYVGFSRARLLLYVLYHRDFVDRFPHEVVDYLR